MLSSRPHLPQRRRSGTHLGIAAAALVLLASGLAAADPNAGAFCARRVADLSRATIDRLAVLQSRCADRVAQGRLPAGTDCTADATDGARFRSESRRLESAIARACPAAAIQEATFGGECAGASDPRDLGACQASVVEGAAKEIVTAVLETPGKLPAGARHCRREAARIALGRSLSRLARVQSCKLRALLDSGTERNDCSSAGSSSEMEQLDARAARDIVRACRDRDVVAAPPSGACRHVRTGADLATCLLGAQQAALEGVLAAEFGTGSTGTTARAALLANPADCVRGPLARCRPGDFVLESSEMRVVVQSIQRNLFGIGQFGGQIIDAARRTAEGFDARDNFEEWAFALNLENTAHYTDLRIVNDGANGLPAVLRATGVDDLLDYINPSSAIGAFGLPFPATSDDTDLPVEIVTDYVLAPGASWVTVETSVRNLGSEPIRTFLGEFIGGSGEVELFQPGYGFGEPTVTTRCPDDAPNACNFFAYRGYGEAAGVTYGYVYEGPSSSTFTAGGVTIPLLGQDVPLALVGGEGPSFEIASAGKAGDTVTVVRHFVLGDGSVSSVSDARDRIQHRAVGRLEGRVRTAGRPVEGAQVAILGRPEAGPGLAPLDDNVVTVARTDAEGRYALTLAPGVYEAAVAKPATPYERSRSRPDRHEIEIDAFATTRLDMTLPETGTLRVTITDERGEPIAARVSVVGFDPSPDPVNRQDVFGIIQSATTWFGDPGVDGMHFGVAKGLLVGPEGDSGEVPIEPGRYRIVVSHGPEYSIDAIDVTVGTGTPTEVAARVARVIDTTGFIAGDFHVHSIDSPDAAPSRRNRVLSMLADGVDFFTPTDHDFRSDFRPVIDAMGVADLLSVAPGAEITPFDYGHFNAWPMTLDPDLVNGGGVDFGGAAPPGDDFPAKGSFSLTPDAVIALAKSDPGESNTVQINHIDTHFGIEGGFGLAIDTGRVPPQSEMPGAARRLDPSIPNYFSDRFDALELWVGDDRYHIDQLLLGQNIGDWFNLLNQGIVRTATSDSDTHQRFSGAAGMPRTMVASPLDAPGELDTIADTLSAHVNAGRVVGSNGPFLRITAEADSTGEIGALDLDRPLVVRTTDGAVRVRLVVQSPIWVEFDTIDFYVNATTERRLEPRQTSAGALSIKRYKPLPFAVQTAGADFEVHRVAVHPGVPGADRFEAVATLELRDLTEDSWIVAIVRGTDGVSQPLFPVMAASLRREGNESLQGLTDGNLGEDGVLAVAFTNPLFVDVDGDGWTAPGLRIRDP
jgi:hypothetical protein